MSSQKERPATVERQFQVLDASAAAGLIGAARWNEARSLSFAR
jgi:hypothetical protein